MARGLSFWLANGHFLAVPPHGREREPSGVSSYKNTNPLGSGTHSHDFFQPLLLPQRPHFQIQPRWRLGLQERDFKETQTLSLQNPPNWRLSVFLRLSTTCTCKQLSQLKDALFPWKKSITSDNNQRRSSSGRNVFPWELKAKTKSHGREDWALN